MVETRTAVLVVGAGPALRLRMDELQRRFDYRMDYAPGPYEAAQHLEEHVVHAVVCEPAPAYTAECRFLRELSERSTRYPVVLYVEPEEEDALLDDLGRGSFYVVRPRATLDEFHRTLREAVEKSRLRHDSPAPAESGGQSPDVPHAKVA